MSSRNNSRSVCVIVYIENHSENELITFQECHPQGNQALEIKMYREWMVNSFQRLALHIT